MWSIQDGDLCGLTENAAAMCIDTGPRIIALALAKNCEGGRRLVSAERFARLCAGYIDVPDALTDEHYREEEVDAIALALISRPGFPPEFIDKAALQVTSKLALFGARMAGNQLRSQGADLRSLIRGWAIFTSIDQMVSGDLTRRVEIVFRMSPKRAFLAGLGAMGLAGTNKGIIRFDGGPSAELQAEYGVTLENVRRFSSLMAISVPRFEVWLNEHVLTKAPQLQRHVDDPFSAKGLVAVPELASPGFLMPVPQFFIRLIPRFIFDTLVDCATKGDQPKNLRSAFGRHLELHIYEALKRAFGDRFSKLPEGTGSADFWLQLETMDVLLELKTGGTPEILPGMTPEAVAGLFRTMCEALDQLSLSRAELRRKDPSRPTMSIIVVADGSGLSTLPFIAYCRESGLLAARGLETLETVSWPFLEAMLSQTSLENLEDGFRRRMARPEFTALHQMAYERTSDALHCFEHLDAAKQDLLGPLLIESGLVDARE